MRVPLFRQESPDQQGESLILRVTVHVCLQNLVWIYISKETVVLVVVKLFCQKLCAMCCQKLCAICISKLYARYQSLRWGIRNTVGAGASTLRMSPGSGDVEVVHVFVVKVVVVVVEQFVQQVHGDGKVMPFRMPWTEWIDDGTTRSRRCCCSVSGCVGSGRSGGHGPIMSCVRGGQAYFDENGSWRHFFLEDDGSCCRRRRRRSRERRILPSGGRFAR